MSRVTRRKHVLKEMMEDDFELPADSQQIVRLVRSRGNNLHEIETADAENFLVSMPVKFRNNVWVKRNDFVVIDRIDEGNKVKGEICKILTSEHIKEFTKKGIWPKKFTKKRDLVEDLDDENTGGEFTIRNINRLPEVELDEKSSSTDED